MTRVLGVLVVLIAVAMAAIAAGNFGFGPVVITREDEQKLVLLLGRVRVVTSPGASLRIPLLEEVETYDARWLHLGTKPLPIQTRDGEQLTVDNYVIWRISDPVRFRQSFTGRMVNAFDRIDGIVRDDVRAVIGRHTLSEVLKERRGAIMQEITNKVRERLVEDGIEVADVRINRTELPEGTEKSVYARMRTERERIAKKNRAEGEERARKIRAEADRDARVIVAEAKRDAEIEKGIGDARAAAIYAEAYQADPEFYAFLRSLQAYEKTIGTNTTLVVSPNSEFFRLFESSGLGREGEGGN
ncbi:MAG: protease modulator HflC [Deltaproteobacteria bacterium]|nr:MAG: protease modulator HflC [Deltaproteobacteria bacterium]TDJ20162.1 MAG: protease modulator HflC [Deltaproteobacteria bacterium]